MPAGRAAGSIQKNKSNKDHQKHEKDHDLLTELNRASLGRGSVLAGSEKVYSHSSFEEAALLPAVRKMNQGRFDDISLQEIDQLFSVMGQSNVLEFDLVRDFLKEVLVPACNDAEVDLITTFTDMNEDKVVSSLEMYSAITAGPIKSRFKARYKEWKVIEKAHAMKGVRAQVDRDLLCERIAWRVNRDDAFSTLPLSAVTIVVFISLVVFHLNIFERRQVAQGIEAYIEGYGEELAGPFLRQYVANLDGMWDWLDRSGVPAVFGGCAEDEDSGLPVCRLASRNVVIGDALLRQRVTNGSEISHWLLHSDRSRAHLANANHSLDFLGAAKAEVQYLRESGWARRDIDELQLTFSTYCQSMRMFAVTQVRAIFDRYGRVSPLASSAAVIVQPYSSFAFIMMDGFYVILLLYPLFLELKDMIIGCQMQGVFESFHDYWGLWNAVDWVSIIMGFVSCGLWVCLCQASGAPSIVRLMLDDDLGSIDPNIMSLTEVEIMQIEADLGTINRLFFYLHLSMGAMAISMILKFFKAFQANPRLRLVTDTMVRAAADIAHFSIVFLAVFLAFSVIGHIFFGGDLVQFSSFGRSINTAFNTLMGEFGWYVDVIDAMTGLPSGMPRGILIFWFWSYMIFVLLILLNMLLAIVLEHYMDLQQEIRKMPDDVPVWVQAKNYLNRARETKGFIPMYDLQCQLEDSSTPAHPERRVTVDSLLNAFGKDSSSSSSSSKHMKPYQAEYIMEMLSKEATRLQTGGEEDETTSVLKEIEAMIEALASDQRVMNLLTENCRNGFENFKVAQQQAAAMGPTDAMKADTPMTKCQITVQLGVQAESIKAMTQMVADVTSRMDAVAPRMQPLPTALREISDEVANIRDRVDTLVEHHRPDVAPSKRAGKTQVSTPLLIPAARSGPAAADRAAGNFR